MFQFLLINKSLVFSTEDDCWPPSFSHLYETMSPKQSGVYRHLNSGAWMGYPKAASEVLTEAEEDRPEWRVHIVHRGGAPEATADLPAVLQRNDQIIFSLLYLSGSNISLDHDAALFQSMHISPIRRTKHIKATAQGVFNLMSGNRPAWIHYNGDSKNSRTGGRLSYESIRKQLQMYVCMSSTKPTLA